MLTYRVEPLPAMWPGVRTLTHQRKRSPFKSNWGSTLQLLEREIDMLNGKDVRLALSVRPDQIRIDGGVYASARIQDPATILSFRAAADRLSFPCDRFAWWEDNVRAIALALEALRAVDRYGVQQGRQYQGFKALPAGAAGPKELTISEAIKVVARHAGRPPAEMALIVTHVDDVLARDVVRQARARTHPDSLHGSPEAFHEAQEAAVVIGAHCGVKL